MNEAMNVLGLHGDAGNIYNERYNVIRLALAVSVGFDDYQLRLR
jgi:chlorite dismutase